MFDLPHAMVSGPLSPRVSPVKLIGLIRFRTSWSPPSTLSDQATINVNQSSPMKVFISVLRLNEADCSSVVSLFVTGRKEAHFSEATLSF
jgi:hypothetical protein